MLYALQWIIVAIVILVAGILDLVDWISKRD